MATLIVAGDYLAHDGQHISALGPVKTDLILGEGIHLHDADAIGNISNVRLWPASCEHDHTCGYLYGLTVALSVEGAYHAHAAENCNFAWGTLIYTNRLEPTYLPNLKIVAESGRRIDCPSSGIVMPGLELVAHGGASLVEPLPNMTCSGTVSIEDRTLSVDAKLPTISVSARVGAKLDVKLPTMEIGATIGDANRGRLERRIPPLQISATGSSDAVGVLTKDLPALEIAASAIEDGKATLDASLPALLSTASVLPGGIGTLDADLPAVKAVALEGTATSMNLDASLPAIVMHESGSGNISGEDSKMIDEERYDDYVLRYQRFG